MIEFSKYVWKKETFETKLFFFGGFATTLISIAVENSSFLSIGLAMFVLGILFAYNTVLSKIIWHIFHRNDINTEFEEFKEFNEDKNLLKLMEKMEKYEN